MRISWKIMKSVIGTKRRTNNNKTSFIINNKIIDNALLIANELKYIFCLRWSNFRCQSSANQC